MFVCCESAREAMLQKQRFLWVTDSLHRLISLLGHLCLLWGAVLCMPGLRLVQRTAEGGRKGRDLKAVTILPWCAEQCLSQESSALATCMEHLTVCN